MGPATLADLKLEFVKTEVRDSVGYLKLARSPVNACNSQMILELDTALTSVRFDDEVRAVILTSDSDIFFPQRIESYKTAAVDQLVLNLPPAAIAEQCDLLAAFSEVVTLCRD
jgi:hypothetical protein